MAAYKIENTLERRYYMMGVKIVEFVLADICKCRYLIEHGHKDSWLMSYYRKILYVYERSDLIFNVLSIGGALKKYDYDELIERSYSQFTSQQHSIEELYSEMRSDIAEYNRLSSKSQKKYLL